MAMSSEDSHQENRFEALLNPVRDLAACWSVNVAEKLSDYVESVGLSIAVPGENKDLSGQFPDSVDFAEAALVVEGATWLYARKVKHLYRLVLDAVTSLIPEEEVSKEQENRIAENVSDLDDLTQDCNAMPSSDGDGSLVTTTKKKNLADAIRDDDKELGVDGNSATALKLVNVGEDTLAVDEGDENSFSPCQPENFSVRVSKTIKDVATLYGITSDRHNIRPKSARKDPFMMLDPSEALPLYDKPTKVGKTYKRARKPFRKEFLPYYDSTPLDTEIEDCLLGKLGKNTSLGNYICCTELKPQYISVQRKRRLKWKNEVSMNSHIILEQFFVDIDSHSHAEITAHEAISGIDFDAFEGVDDLAPPAFHSDEYENDDSGGFFDSDDPNGCGSVAPGLEETYREHLERIASMWKHRTVDTHMVRRVEQWTSRIQPLLEEEEQRPEFDISCYEKEILNEFHGIAQEHGAIRTRISRLIREPARFEVCRKFLAILQLANGYEIEIHPPGGCLVEDFFVDAISNDRGGRKGNASILKEREDQALSFNHSDEKENRDPLLETVVVTPPKRGDSAFSKDRGAKRGRLPGSTPKSQKRLPLRPRLHLLNTPN